ncbi:DinB family protein [Aquimarina sp. M1]
METQLLETWQIQNQLNLYLLEHIDEADLDAEMTSKGRSVFKQFAHINNVRLMWLKEAAPEIYDSQHKIEMDNNLSKELLQKKLVTTGELILMLLSKGIAENRIKGFKPHPLSFLGYLIAHEAHHRSQIIIALKQSGKPVSKKIGFGLWEWGTKI